MILVFYCIFFEVSPVDIIFGIRVFFIAFVGKKKKKGKNISILFALSCISGALEMHQRVLKAGKAGSLLQVAVPTPDPVPFRGLGMLVAITC